MPLPIDDATDAHEASRVLIEGRKRIYNEAVRWIDLCDTGTINLNDLIDGFCCNHLGIWSPRWNSARSVEGVAAVIRERFPGAGYDTDQEVLDALQSAQNAIDTAVSAIEATIPKDGNGWLLVRKVTNHVMESRMTSNAGSISTLRGLLVTLRDAFST